MFKFIFNILTEPLGLPIEWYWEYVILVIIGMTAYHLAYNKVGDFYDDGLISGSGVGSFLHWAIRLVFFIVIWAIIYFVIVVGKFIMSNWQLIVLISACVIGIVILCVAIVMLMRHIKKKRRIAESD